MVVGVLLLLAVVITLAAHTSNLYIFVKYPKAQRNTNQYYKSCDY